MCHAKDTHLIAKLCAFIIIHCVILCLVDKEHLLEEYIFFSIFILLFILKKKYFLDLYVVRNRYQILLLIFSKLN